MKIYHNWKFWEFVESSATQQNKFTTSIDVETRAISEVVRDVLEYVPSRKEEYYNRLKHIIMRIMPTNTIQYNTQTQEYNHRDWAYQAPLHLLFWSDIGSSNGLPNWFPSIVFYAKKCDEDGNVIEDEWRYPYEHIENITALSNLLFKKYPNLSDYLMGKIVQEFITQVAPIFLEQIAKHYSSKLSWSMTEDILIEVAEKEIQKSLQAQQTTFLIN